MGRGRSSYCDREQHWQLELASLQLGQLLQPERQWSRTSTSTTQSVEASSAPSGCRMPCGPAAAGAGGPSIMIHGQAAKLGAQVVT